MDDESVLQLCQAICAFANDFPRTGRPGIVVIGQHDKGHATGLSITDELLRELSDLRNIGLILPFPQMSVRRVSLLTGQSARISSLSATPMVISRRSPGA